MLGPGFMTCRKRSSCPASIQTTEVLISLKKSAERHFWPDLAIVRVSDDSESSSLFRKSTIREPAGCAAIYSLATSSGTKTSVLCKYREIGIAPEAGVSSGTAISSSG